MKVIKKLLKMMMVGIVSIIGILSSMMGSALSYVFSLVAGLTSICTVWAWLAQDAFFPLFLGITVSFIILMVIAARFSDGSIALALKLKGFFKSR